MKYIIILVVFKVSSTLCCRPAAKLYFVQLFLKINIRDHLNDNYFFCFWMGYDQFQGLKPGEKKYFLLTIDLHAEIRQS